MSIENTRTYITNALDYYGPPFRRLPLLLVAVTRIGHILMAAFLVDCWTDHLLGHRMAAPNSRKSGTNGNLVKLSRNNMIISISVFNESTFPGESLFGRELEEHWNAGF